MSDHLKNFGVPLGDNKRGGIIQSLAAYRFRLNSTLDSVTANTESVHFDFAKKEINILVRATILGQDFEQAIRFGNRCHFTVDALDGGLGVLFNIAPMVLKLEAQDLQFSYKENRLMHSYKFSFQDIDVRYLVPETEDEAPKDPRFLSMEEALEVIQNLEKKIDPKTGKQILTEEAPKSKVVTIMEDPVERGDAGC